MDGNGETAVFYVTIETTIYKQVAIRFQVAFFKMGFP